MNFHEGILIDERCLTQSLRKAHTRIGRRFRSGIEGAAETLMFRRNAPDRSGSYILSQQ